jgi:hypothetical protein
MEHNYNITLGPNNYWNRLVHMHVYTKFIILSATDLYQKKLTFYIWQDITKTL